MQGGQLRHRVRHFGFLARAGYRRDAQRGGRVYQNLPRHLSGREEIYGGHQADRQGAGLRYDPVRPPPRAARAEEQELQYALVR